MGKKRKQKEIGQEHLHLSEEGALLGLHTIDTEKAKDKIKGRWERIDAIIKAYTDIHPNEMRAQIIQNQMTRLYDTNDGFTKLRTMRFGVSMPPLLLLKIEAVEPEMFTDRKLFTQFMRRYSGLTVVKDV